MNASSLAPPTRESPGFPATLALGVVSLLASVAAAAAPVCSTTPIVSGGHGFGQSSPYPSLLQVSDTTGVISQMDVTLTGLTHSFPDDLDVRLTAPSGRTVVLMSDVGGSVPASGLTLTLSDDAGVDLPYGDGATGLSSGTFRPRNQTQDVVFNIGGLPMPSAAQPYGGTLGWLRGEPANGTWRLYAWDDAAGEGHDLAIAQWCLDIETTPTAPACLSQNLTGRVDHASPALTSLPIDYGMPSTCGRPWQCRTRAVQQGVRYALHSFVNDSAETRCVTATVTMGQCETLGGTGGLTALGYVGSFDADQICGNATGAAGDGHVPHGGTFAYGPNAFAFAVPAKTDYHVAVIEAVSGSIVHPGHGCSYSLLIEPGVCPGSP
jgi:hypothetical protein